MNHKPGPVMLPQSDCVLLSEYLGFPVIEIGIEQMRSALHPQGPEFEQWITFELQGEQFTCTVRSQTHLAPKELSTWVRIAGEAFRRLPIRDPEAFIQALNITARARGFK